MSEKTSAVLALCAPLFDFKNPDYTHMLRERRRRIARIRRDPSLLPVLRELYKRNPQQWLYDWACTFDPRNAERDLPTTTPFPAMPFQDNWLSFVLECWRCQAYGLTEKSRETGLSWLAVFFAIWMCTHYRGTTVGFGSNLADNVDMLGNPRSLLEKIRIGLRHLPREFRGGWTEDAPGNKENQIVFPAMSSMIIGQAGNKIGRGDRTSLYYCDEAAHIEQPLLVDAALSGTTNCRQDISSVFGFATPFAEKVSGGKHPTFRASWRDDLRKDEKWHQRMVDQYGADIVGQEFDADPFAGREGQLIDARSVKAAIDIHKRLNIPMTGKTRAGMDVATRGRDLSALAIRTGVVLRHCSAWREEEVSGSVKRVHKLMRKFNATHYYFDGVGVGGSVDDINKLLQPDRVVIRAEMYQGSEAPLNLKRNFPGTTVSNETLFPMQAGRKHQAWWYLRYLFDNTWRLSQGDTSVDTDEIISIDSETVEDINGLVAELSQPTYTTNNSGKIIVDKFGDTGTRSPNRADSLLMAFAMEPFHMNTGALLRAVMAAPPSSDSFTAQLGHLRF